MFAMTGPPQGAMRKASQSWQIFFPSQTLHVFYFSFAKPLDFWFGPSQKGTICSSVNTIQHTIQDMYIYVNPMYNIKFHILFNTYIHMQGASCSTLTLALCEDYLHTFTIKICTHIKPGWKWNYYVVVV
jgi:hypothetical protein